MLSGACHDLRACRCPVELAQTPPAADRPPAPIAPVVALVCFAYFAVAVKVYSHQFLYVYVRAYETGGARTWPTLTGFYVLSLVPRPRRRTRAPRHAQEGRVRRAPASAQAEALA